MTEREDRPGRRDEVVVGQVAGGLIGGILLLYGRKRRGRLGWAVGLVGAGILASSLVPRVAPRVRARRRRRTIDVSGSLVVDRPIREVFAFFRNFEHFPLLGGIVHEITDFDDGRSRWSVRARGGDVVEWDVLVTKYLPPRVIAWESTPGGPVESSGEVRFTAIGPHSTGVDVALHYHPLTQLAARAIHPLVARRPERRVRAAIGRIEGAMRRSEAPDSHPPVPQFPLPELSPST